MEEEEIFKVFKDNRRFANDGHSFNGALWEVSNYGRVRKNGEDYTSFSTRGNGYYVFGKKHYYVHRAVAELFLEENIYQKPTVDHKNRCIHDNRASNLRWATWDEQAANRNNDAIIASRKGKKLSEEHKAKISAANLGHSTSEETKAKISAANLGHSTSEETKAKISAALLGCKRSEETKAKMSAAKLGCKRSEETKAKIGKYAHNAVWVIHPMTNDIKRIPKEQVPDYLAKGYVKGKKIKK